MTECKKCGKLFSIRFKDNDGKEHNCQRRKYCFDCSPYGCRNTSKLETIKSDANGLRICNKCGKSFMSKRRLVCNTCNVNKQRQRKKDYLMSIVGYNCWRCGYGGSSKYVSILDMHHINPDNKMFDLNITSISKKSKYEILEESKKCVLLCSNCHREYHYTDLISDYDIIELHKKWSNIKI